MVVVRGKAGEVAVGKACEVVVKEKSWKFEIVVSSFQTPHHMTYLSSFFFRSKSTVISVCKSGPVRSFGPKLKDRDRDWSTFILELKKTGPDR